MDFGHWQGFIKPDSESYDEVGIYYTEDDIPIRTLYVANIFHKAKEQHIRDYFTKFGEVERVIIKNNPQNNFTYSFVTLKNCEDAAKVLKKDKHSIFKRTVRICGADSWHQPEDCQNKKRSHICPKNWEYSGWNPTDAKDFESTTINSKEEKPPEVNVNEGGAIQPSDDVPFDESKSLLLLNDDCILHVINFLGFFDQRRLEKTCRRLQDLVQIVYKKYSNFNFNNIQSHADGNITLMDTREIFHAIGSKIISLTMSAEKFSASHHRIITMIPRYCNNLRHLKVYGFTMNETSFKRFVKLYPQLESLELIRCGINEKISKYLAMVKNLKTLNFKENFEITGRCLSSLSGLESLNLEDCNNIQSSFIQSSFVNNKGLRYLNIGGCSRLNAKIVDEIVTNLAELEHLVISNIYSNFNQQEMIKFSELPNLKRVQIKSNGIPCSGKIYGLLMSLADRNQLEFLDLGGISLAEKGFSCLSRLTKLKVIKLNNDMDFEDNYLRDIIKPQNILEEVHLSGITLITNEGVTYVIKSCPQLRLLDISGCELVSNEAIINAEEFLKAANTSVATKRQKIKIIAGQTNIHTTLTNQNLEYIDISYDCTFQSQIFDLEFFHDGWMLDYMDDDNEYDESDDDYDNFALMALNEDLYEYFDGFDDDHINYDWINY